MLSLQNILNIYTYAYIIQIHIHYIYMYIYIYVDIYICVCVCVCVCVCLCVCVCVCVCAHIYVKINIHCCCYVSIKFIQKFRNNFKPLVWRHNKHIFNIPEFGGADLTIDYFRFGTSLELLVMSQIHFIWISMMLQPCICK